MPVNPVSLSLFMLMVAVLITSVSATLFARSIRARHGALVMLCSLVGIVSAATVIAGTDWIAAGDCVGFPAPPSAVVGCFLATVEPWRSQHGFGSAVLNEAAADLVLSRWALFAGTIGAGVLIGLLLARPRDRRGGGARFATSPGGSHRAQRIGAAGESLTACELAGLGWPLLRNVILLEGNRSVETDFLLRVGDGIVALEVKTYAGFISGSEDSPFWTQHLSGRQTQFLNPAIQNLAHVRALERFVSDCTLSIRGFVVSAGRARFADEIANIPVPLEVLRDVLRDHARVAPLDQGRIDNAWRRLAAAAERSDARREAHSLYAAGRQAKGWRGAAVGWRGA
jgi:hypothetical protein